MKSGSLFTGTAALDMAAAEIFGAELSWVAEYEPPTKKNRKPAQAASRLLAHHFPDVPNLRDITRVGLPYSDQEWAAMWARAAADATYELPEPNWDLVRLLSPIEILTSGWPCQPFSNAGQQLGADDERALWPYVDRCIRALRPRYVLLENVPAVAGCGELERVANTLASHGYRFAWVCFPASAVGAPHQRERFFLLAVADAEDERHERPRPARRRRAGSPNGGDAAADAAGSGSQGSVRPETASGAQPSAVADAERGRGAPASHASRRGLGADEHDDAAREPDVGRRAAPDANGGGFAGNAERDLRAQGGLAAPQRDDAERRVLDWAGYGPAVRRWESVLGRSAPAPTTVGARGGEALNPAFVEWMMGLPDGWITAVPGLTRAQQIKLGGNGVVKHQAAAAYRYLLDVLERDTSTRESA